MRSKYMIIYFGIVIFMLISSCRHTGPVDVANPNDNNKPKRGYYLYVGNWGYDDVFVVDTDSNAVVDSIKGFPYTVWYLAVTTSGAKLYVCTRSDNPPVNSGKIFSVDIKTKQLKLIHNEISDVFVSPGGMVFVISYSYDVNSSRGLIGVIDTLTDAITYFDTLDIRDQTHNYQSIVFDKNRSLLYGVTNEKQLFSYDYTTKKVVKRVSLGYEPLQMALTSDGTILYFTAFGNRLVSFNVHKDSILAVARANQLSSLALSKDETYLYVTDPGRYAIFEPPPSGKVFIFQTSTNRFIGDIDVNKAVPFGHSNLTDRIVLAPDGETAYVSYPFGEPHLSFHA